MLRAAVGRLGVVFAVVAAVVVGLVSVSSSVGAATKAKPPAIKHVFVINLENKSYDETWGAASQAPYLSETLKAEGVFLSDYYAIGHVSLDNYIAEISGQGPSKQTQTDCLGSYSEFVSTGTGSLHQALGDGCVYPATVKTIADQLAAKHLTWKAYMEDMATPCKHPVIGAKDDSVVATASSGYATRHNPFVYFHSIIDTSVCAANDVPLTALSTDLASVKTTPNYSMITPNLCNDGHDAQCPDGSTGGLTAANTWLQTWVPKILASPAFKKDGLLMVTFDEAEAVGTSADATNCCTKAKPPNVPNASLLPPGPGGGKVGAVLISPFIKAGTTSATPYNHYAMLCSMENIFGLARLGYAGEPGLACFGPDVYTNTSATVKSTKK
jgi:hypothetical protein